MLLFALALATMPVPIGSPLPGDLGGLAMFVSETRAAATRVDLTVDAAGAPVHCAVTVSDGNRLLDRAACDLLMKKTHFTPARDAVGAPVVAVVRRDFTVNREFGVRGNGGVAATAAMVDFAVAVDHVAPGAMPVADLVLTTDAAGRVATCDVARSTRQPALDRLACKQMTGTVFTPARDRAGQPASAQRAVSVGFVTGPVPQ